MKLNPYDNYPLQADASRLVPEQVPIVVTLKIEASPWALVRDTDDKWTRTWKGWEWDKTTAARVVQCGIDDRAYQWACWSLYSDEHIGYGFASTREEAQKLADETLREYCRASEARGGTMTAELDAVSRLRTALKDILEVALDADNLFAMTRPTAQIEQIAKDALGATDTTGTT